MNIYKQTIAAVVLAFAITSCDTYLDVNDDPNNPTESSVQPDLLLAGALEASYRNVLATDANEAGNVLVNHWAGDINNVTGGFQDEFTLNITTTYRQAIWNEMYRSLGTFQAILDNPSEDFDNHKAIAKIVKSFHFQTIVDIYGDVPYSEALQRGENLTPIYDDAQEIYRDLIVQLDAAIAEINSADDTDAVVGMEDIVFQGDMSKWIQFANTAKLRILVRQMELAETDGATASYLNEQFASLEKNFLTEDAAINPGYINAQAQQNPFYTQNGFDAQGVPSFDYNFIVPTEFSAEFLKGEPTGTGITTGVFDPRVNRLYDPLASGEVVGVVQGEDNTTAPPQLSELGPGVIISSEQDGYLMMSSESLLLQAEAITRGYMSGNGKALFQQAIVDSFIRLGLSTTEANDYLTQSNDTNLIGWDGSPNKVEAIIYQKWIALCSIHGMELYIEYNRTGYPDIPLPTIAQQPNRPVRLLYPASEYSTNSANVPNQSASAAFNDRIFWDVN